MHYLAGLLRYEGTVTCIIVYAKKKFMFTQDSKRNKTYIVENDRENKTKV